MSRARAGLLVTILCLAFPAQATEAQRRDVYTVRPWLDGSIAVAGGLASLVPLALSNEIVTVRCPCDTLQVPAFDRNVIGNRNGAARTVSDVTLGLSVAAPIIVDFFDVGWSRTLLDDAIVFAQALAVTGATTTLFKYMLQRPYPILYDNPTPQQIKNGESYLAFYSGHVSVTFTMLTVMAMTLTLRHGFSIWPWLIVAVVGTSVAVERVAAGQHFYSDVIVGSLMGTAVGVLIPWFHIRRDWGAPTVSADARTVVMGWQREW